MSLVESGLVTSVDSKPVGSPLIVAATAGDQVLVVDDNTDFTPGDRVWVIPEDAAVAPDLYVIGAVADDTGITLTSPLLNAAPDGTWVATDPLQYETIAMVRLLESGDMVPCVVLHGLADALPLGFRDEASAETVRTFQADEDTRYVFDVVARKVVRDVTDATLGDQPLIQLQIDLDNLNNVTLPQVQTDLAAARSDIANIQGLFPITSTSISDSAITTPKLAANAVTADKIVANTITGDKLVALTITGDKIAANTIGADKIVANSIGADRLAANSVTAGKIAAGAIDGMTLTGVVITASGGVSASDGNFTRVSVTDYVTAFGNITGAKLFASSPGTAGATDGDAVRMGASGQILRVTSAAKYKTDIRDAAIDFDAWEQLRVVTARRIENGRVETGVIADQAAELGLDEWVGRVGGEIETFRYDGMSPVLLAFAQKHTREIRDLRAEIQTLKDTR